MMGDDASECAGRQLAEIEMLQAMFPEPEFEGISAEALEAAQATVDAAEEAGAAVELPPHSFSITVQLEEAEGTPELRLGFTLPPLYPERSPPAVVVGLPGLARKQRDGLAAALVAAARQRTELAEDGEECICDLVQQGQELATELLAAAAEAAADPADAMAPTQQAVIRIDHMNDSRGYLKKLEAWAGQLGLAGRIFYREAGTAKASGRVEGVVAVLEGEDEGVGAWLTRLRSEYVDVDGRGGKCKERKSTVMCRRETEASLEGWVVAAYTEQGELETALAGLDVLHVGSGETRWGGGGREPEPEPEPEPGPEMPVADGQPPPWLEVIGAGSVLTRVHLSAEVNTGKQATTLTNAAELRRRTVAAARFDIAAQPRNGAANKELCAHIAGVLGCKKGDVSIAAGHKSREKTIAVEGVAIGDIERLLLLAL